VAWSVNVDCMHRQCSNFSRAASAFRQDTEQARNEQQRKSTAASFTIGVLLHGVLLLLFSLLVIWSSQSKPPEIVTYIGDVVKALDWLSKNQNTDGSLAKDPKYVVGLTGLSLLPYLGHCETVASRKYGKNVEGAIDYLTRKMKDADVGTRCVDRLRVPRGWLNARCFCAGRGIVPAVHS